VWLRDQNRKLPNDSALYIDVGIVNSYVMSSETYIRDGAPSNNWDQLGQTYDTPAVGGFDSGNYDLPGRSYDQQSGVEYDQGVVENFDQPGQDFDVSGQTWDAKQNATTEVNKLQMREDIQIDIFSRSNAAIFRNWEVIAALQSIYSQQQQELVNFKIFRCPRAMINTSSAEGGYQLNRYTITISCFVWYVKETLLTTNNGDYYDDFHQRVDTHKTIGSVPPYNYDQGNTWDSGQNFDNLPPIITFEINQQGIQP
jgi:hypothetical protein